MYAIKCNIDHAIDMVYNTPLHNKNVTINCQFEMARHQICTAKDLLGRPTFVLWH